LIPKQLTSSTDRLAEPLGDQLFGDDLRRALDPRLLDRRKEQIGGNAETGAKRHHGHAQALLAAKDFADTARDAQERVPKNRVHRVGVVATTRCLTTIHSSAIAYTGAA
jgi:hypothetical protein